MKCPTDGTDLAMTERSGVEIDYCPKCRGVWLDRGELDKILERSEAGSTPAAGPPQYEQGYGGKHGGKHGGYGQKRRKGMLGELFDF